MTRRSPVAATSLAVGALIAVGLYVAAFHPSTVRNVGWDAEGYVVQMRAASRGIVDLPGTRPGVAVTGATVAGIGLAPVGAAPIVVSITVAACLGLAATVGLRRTWTLPASAVGVAVLLVACWGGTARLSSGYLANLLSLVLFVLAAVLAITPVVGWAAILIAFVAALLAHPGLWPAYAAILGGWALAEVLLDRRDRASIRALGAFLGASAIVLVVVGGLLGVGFDDLQDLAVVRQRFGARAAELLAWIDPLLSLSMVAAGGIVAFARRDATRSRAALRLGIAWLAVSAGGLVLLALVPSIPGHRALLLGVPAPMLGALALVAGGMWLTQRAGSGGARSERDQRERSPEEMEAGGARGGAVRPVVGVAIAVLSVAVAVLALRPFEARAGRPSGTIGAGPGAVAGYLQAVDPGRPVVLVMDPPVHRDLLAWKARLNAVRALAPDATFLDVVLYVGDTGSLSEGRSTARPGDDLFQAISSRTWPSVRDVLDDDPIVLVVRPWVPAQVWARVAGDAPVVAGDVGVLRGPAPTETVDALPAPRLPLVEAGVRIVLLLLLLGLVGGGWSAATIHPTELPDAIGLAPAFGLAVVTLVGMGVALVDGDPGGSGGLAVLGLATLAGWGAAIARRRRT